MIPVAIIRRIRDSEQPNRRASAPVVMGSCACFCMGASRSTSYMGCCLTVYLTYRPGKADIIWQSNKNSYKCDFIAALRASSRLIAYLYSTELHFGRTQKKCSHGVPGERNPSSRVRPREYVSWALIRPRRLIDRLGPPWTALGRTMAPINGIDPPSAHKQTPPQVTTNKFREKIRSVGVLPVPSGYKGIQNGRGAGRKAGSTGAQ